LFFPLVLGIWWKRANRAGAIAGMIGGLASGTAYLYAVKFAGMDPWLGIDHLRFGMIGMPVSLILMVVVSKATEAPDEETMKMVDSIRIPKGEVVQNS
jgi:cation/acetate symporter